MRRTYRDPDHANRCTAVVTLKDKTTADCGRQKKIGDLCLQHYKIERARSTAQAAFNGVKHAGRTLETQKQTDR